MADTLARIAKENPDLAQDERVIAASNEADLQGAISAFNTSEGGMILRASLSKDLCDYILDIANNADTYSHLQFMQRATAISARMDLLVTMGAARTKFDAAVQAITALTVV